MLSPIKIAALSAVLSVASASVSAGPFTCDTLSDKR